MRARKSGSRLSSLHNAVRSHDQYHIVITSHKIDPKIYFPPKKKYPRKMAYPICQFMADMAVTPPPPRSNFLVFPSSPGPSFNFLIVLGVNSSFVSQRGFEIRFCIPSMAYKMSEISCLILTAVLLLSRSNNKMHLYCFH